jgi:hypothetical protein
MALSDWFSKAVPAVGNTGPDCDPGGGPLKVTEMIHVYNFFKF